jgi:hypothetical protein
MAQPPNSTLATCCLVEDPALKQYAFGSCIGSKWCRHSPANHRAFADDGIFNLVIRIFRQNFLYLIKVETFGH